VIPRPTLPTIVAHARSGSLNHAWKLFRQAGFDQVDDDPAVLSVRGRLLKDGALAAEGEARRQAYLSAADSYARAADLEGDVYPLINAATLSLLAGLRDPARWRAQQVLERIAAGVDEAETPYWRVATRGEALLLLGRIDEAREALGEAIASAPKAWEDHASTLRQFALILDAQDQDSAWLDACRPPRALHFAGHMGLASEDPGLRARIAEHLVKERIGFGFGALAAGADILIAETLLDHGAELHLILPTGVEDFREASVDRYGIGWAIRFDQILHRAESLRALGPAAGSTHPLAIRLAAEIAMGGAVMKARTYLSEATQLLVLDRPEPEPDDTGASAWIKSAWARGGLRQHILVAPRETPRPSDLAQPETAAAVVLAALLVLDLTAEVNTGDRRQDELVSEILPKIAAILADAPAPLAPPQWRRDAVLLTYAKPDEAAQVAAAIVAALAETTPLRVGGHYGLVRRFEDPLGSGVRIVGAATDMAFQVLASTPTGAIHVTEDFAAALHATPIRHGPRTEYIGDLPPADVEDEMRLFSLKP
jgi:tetratricopeptide (TPR) repeat protein